MKWWKFLIGLILLPALVAVGWTLVDQTVAGWKGQEWQESWFWGLGGGFTLWLVAYLALPRPMWVYVFGHELTHALAVYMQGGKVLGFRVATYGGHVKTDTINWWTSLSPYFIPLYCLIWLGLWIVVTFYYPLHGWEWILYGGIGLTWGFHVTFTISMIKVGQSDISSQGYLFSFVVILLINFLLIELFLLGVLGHYSFSQWGHDLWSRLSLAYLTTGEWIWLGLKWCWQQTYLLWQKLRS